MSKYKEQLAVQIREALGPHNDPELPVVECVSRLASRGGVPELEPYDAGFLSDYGGGNVDWWQDYIRSELARAHDFYQSQLAASQPERQEGEPAEVTILPDGSAFAVVSTPLPENHWLYGDASKEDEHGYEPSPMPFRMATGPSRSELQDKVRAAGKYALRASTSKGKEPDFDPDAVIQNLIVGLFGYHTEDGLFSDSWANPSPVPPLMDPAEGQARPIMEPRPTKITAGDAGYRVMERYGGALRQMVEGQAEELLAAVNRACEFLPVGHMMNLGMENGAAWVELFDEDGNSIELPDSADTNLIEQIDAAIAAAQQQEGRGDE